MCIINVFNFLQQDIKLLPRKEMLSILSDVIVESEGHNKEAKIQVCALKFFFRKLILICAVRRHIFAENTRLLDRVE